ncbi:Uncharacterised protein [Dorea longicatena]|jgi:hypothetical protein|uniref:Uncharacterized protein n=1 Tax=Dorea longicatena TaxID=88431 RepID=A0A173S9H3_9FIRM|nr:hypothetical protein [Dorea longicatena]CUM87003.1 Uncharacterised protein [Dorea longicatena]
MAKRPDVAVNKIEFDSSEVDMALRKKFQKNRYFYITGAILVHCGNARSAKEDLQQHINREYLMGQIYIIAINVEKHLIGEINYAH